MSVGKAIKSLRKLRGYSQAELADKCGLSRNSIYNYENGKRDASVETFIAIANALDVDISHLIPKISVTFPEDNSSTDIPIPQNVDSELLQFISELSKRESMQLLFKQAKNLSDNDILTIIKIIKAIEDQEDKSHDTP